MSDEGDPQFDYALQVRNNRWRLVVGLPSMAAAATAVARIAKSEEATTVAVEVYDPIKGTYQRKDRLTFTGRRSNAPKAALASLIHEFRRLPFRIRLAFAVVMLPVLGLAALGTRGLVTGPSAVAAPPRTEEVILPPPSRALPREWTSARGGKEIPPAFRGEWSQDCASARGNGTPMLTVSALSLFGQPVNWVRTRGGRVLVNTGPDGQSLSTQIRSDGLVLFLEERFAEVPQTSAERASYSSERPVVLSKCL